MKATQYQPDQQPEQGMPQGLSANGMPPAMPTGGTWQDLEMARSLPLPPGPSYCSLLFIRGSCPKALAKRCTAKGNTDHKQATPPDPEMS